MQKLLFIFFLLWTLLANLCIGPNGEAVNWWVKLIFPKSVGSKYAYFDSRSTKPSFEIYSSADENRDPLKLTLLQINTLAMQSVAWNDEQPNGKTASSSKAHSKGVIGYNMTAKKGFFICHSIPKFPAFQGKTVDPTIQQAQTKYGQHAFCLSITNSDFYDIPSKILPIKPSIYASSFKGVPANPKSRQKFTYKNSTVNGTKMMFIFKNGDVNASIFEDGLNQMLKSSLLAETWTRPQQKPWCGSKYRVGNIQKIKLSQTFQWKITQDHSKWAYALDNNYSCFGDMNRQDSQWKRGGAFYCIDSPLLKEALAKATVSSDQCQ